jgi:hypothetical protein
VPIFVAMTAAVALRALQALPRRPLGFAVAVERGVVEEVDAGVERSVDGRGRLRFGDLAVRLAGAQGHAAESDGRDVQVERPSLRYCIVGVSVERLCLQSIVANVILLVGEPVFYFCVG